MSKVRFVREIAYELEQLGQLAEVARGLAAVEPEQRRPWDGAAAAKYIADLCVGLENLCKRRYRYLEQEPPSEGDSHQRMLADFLAEEGLGGALPGDVAFRLKKYLRFRHRFVHGYGHQVSWEIVEEPLRLLPETVERLSWVWRQWAAALPEDAPGDRALE